MLFVFFDFLLLMILAWILFIIKKDLAGNIVNFIIFDSPIASFMGWTTLSSEAVDALQTTITHNSRQHRYIQPIHIDMPLSLISNSSHSPHYLNNYPLPTRLSKSILKSTQKPLEINADWFA